MDLRTRLNDIHARLLAGSRTASRDLFLEALSPLRAFLAGKFRGLSEDELHDLATDAIVVYVGDPGQCNLSRASLWTYLCNVAKRDAIDFIRMRRRRKELLEEVVESDVEFWATRAKDSFRGENAIDARQIMKLHGGRLVTSETEAKVLALILHEERRTETFAEALGIDPGAADTREIVKQAKDRMLLRLKRLRDEL